MNIDPNTSQADEQDDDSGSDSGSDDLFTDIYNNLPPGRKLLTVTSCNMLKDLDNLIGTVDLDTKLYEQNGERALHIACSKGFKGIVQKLLDAGADPDIRNDFGFTPIAMGLRHDHVECVRLILASVYLIPGSEQVRTSKLSNPDMIWLSEQLDGKPLWLKYSIQMIKMLLIATPNFSGLHVGVQALLYEEFIRSGRKANLVKIFLLTGNVLKPHQMTSLVTDCNEELAMWLRNFKFVKPLRHISRLAIRRSLRPNCYSAAKLLQLPKELISYLVFANECIEDYVEDD